MARAGIQWLQTWGVLFVSCLCCTLAQFLLQMSPIIVDWENRFQEFAYDLRYVMRLDVNSKSDILIIKIDDHSLPVGLSKTPLDRAWLAQLIDQITARNPKIIALHLLLDQKINEHNDSLLTHAIEKAENVILLSNDMYPLEAQFKNAALGHGLFRLKMDSNGTIREICEEAAPCHKQPLFHRAIWKILFPRKAYPTTSYNGWLKINFLPPAGNQGNIYHSSQINRIPDELIQNRLVLLDVDFDGIYPRYKTPFYQKRSDTMSTIEITAQVMKMLILNRPIRRLPDWNITLFYFLILILIGLLIKATGYWIASVGFLLINVCLIAGSVVGLASFDLETPIVLPLMISCFYVFILMGYKSHRRVVAALHFELELRTTKMEFLTNELIRHDLFNELTKIISLIKTVPETAQEYIRQYANMLRYSLKHGDQIEASIGEQMEFIDSYIQRQKLIEDKLQFEIHIDRELEETSAPWSIFFPFVENAVKYTQPLLVHQSETPLSIQIQLKKEDDQIVFQVMNPFKERQKPSTKVIPERFQHLSEPTQKGLENLKKRLSLFYPPASFQLYSQSQETTWLAVMKIPYGSDGLISSPHFDWR